jgi:hypothetical protein
MRRRRSQRALQVDRRNPRPRQRQRRLCAALVVLLSIVASGVPGLAGGGVAAAATGAVGAGSLPLSVMKYTSSSTCSGVVTLPNGTTQSFSGRSTSITLDDALLTVPPGTLVAGDREAAWQAGLSASFYENGSFSSCENAAYGTGTGDLLIYGPAVVVADDDEPAMVGQSVTAQIQGPVSYQRIGSTTVLSLAPNTGGATYVGNQQDSSRPFTAVLNWVFPGAKPGDCTLSCNWLTTADGTYSQGTPDVWAVALLGAPVASSGSAVTLEAVASQNASSTTWVEIVDQTTNTTLRTCTSGQTCSVSVNQTVGASQTSVNHTYVARIRDSAGVKATSNTTTVTWVAAPWAVSLEAAPPAAPSGTAVTLAAQSSRDVGAYAARIEIVDQTAGGAVIQTCTSGQTCTASVSQTVPSGQTSVSRNYIARVMSGTSTLASTAAATTVVWASTAPPPPPPAPWAVALEAAPPAASSGQSVSLTAAASADVGPAGARIEIVDQTAGGVVIATCTTGRTCATNVSQLVPSGQVSTTRSYIARVMSGTTTLATSNPPTTVVWALNANIEFPSGECWSASSTTVAEGYVSGVYTRLLVQQFDADTAWVCFRADNGSSVTFGGKIVIDGTVGVPTTDANDAACATSGNSVPGPHPMIGPGQIGDPNNPPYVPYRFDVYANTSAAWVCLQVGTAHYRVTVPIGVPSAVTPLLDSPGHDPFTPAPAPDPVAPSSTCQTSGGTLLYDANVDGVQGWLYTQQVSSTQLNICVRIQNASNTTSVGGMLSINLNAATAVAATSSTDMSPCTATVITNGNPVPFFISRSPNGALPASLCIGVNGTNLRVTVDPGAATGTVTWNPDPGTPRSPARRICRPARKGRAADSPPHPNG